MLLESDKMIGASMPRSAKSELIPVAHPLTVFDLTSKHEERVDTSRVTFNGIQRNLVPEVHSGREVPDVYGNDALVPSLMATRV
jgi:hypothetical protein